MYFDSDNLLTRPLTHADVFERYRGSSDPQTDRASRYQLHLPAVAWARYGAMHEAAWRSRLASMLGLSVPETRYTTMCRGGGLTYPAWMHSELRAHLHQVMGGRSLHEHAAHLLEDRKVTYAREGDETRAGTCPSNQCVSVPADGLLGTVCTC